MGVWYVNSELYENAITFFERAAQIEPKEVKWKLMVASCYRRMRNYQHAIHIYKTIHENDPENSKCLEYLCVILKEINDPSLHVYESKLSELTNNEPVVDDGRDFVQHGVDENDRVQPIQSPPVEKLSSRESVSIEKVPTEEDWGDGELGDDLLPS